MQNNLLSLTDTLTDKDLNIATNPTELANK